MKVNIPDLYTVGGNKVDRAVEVHLRQGEIESVMAKSHLNEVKEFDITNLLTMQSREKILAHLKEKEMEERQQPKSQRSVRLSFKTIDDHVFEDNVFLCVFTPPSSKHANVIVHSMSSYGSDYWPVTPSGVRMKVLELLGSNPE